MAWDFWRQASATPEDHPREALALRVEGAGNSAAIEGRVKQLRAQVEDTTSDDDREKLQERLAKRPALPRALVPLRGKVYCQGSRFPETATTSLGVLQPWPLPSSKLVSPEIRLP
jgi:hypothetical protein